MRIVVNSLPAKGLLTGIGRYVQSLYASIMEFGCCDLTFFDGMQVEETIPRSANPEKFVSRIDTLGKFPWWVVTWLRVAYWLVFEKRLERIVKNVKALIYHEPGFFPAKISACPQVFTLYDLSLLKMPHMHPKDRVAFFRFFFLKRLTWADHILTISEFMKDEILHYLPVAPEKVTAVHLAPSKAFHPRPYHVVKETMDRYGLKPPFILAVGSIDPRKNLKLLLRALFLADRKDLTLAIVGWKGWGYGELEDEIRRLENKTRVRLLGYIPDEDLAALYGGASMMVYPSLYEGFGLPILEAMACGCPVICAKTSSLPEVAGDAAVFVSPHNPGELAGSILALLDDPSMRQSFVERGFCRAAQFSWEKTAFETLKVFQSLL
ncbi:MAG: glycosyltransferase family 1 protein [Thermodesulforhabdaceae bacterium]